MYQLKLSKKERVNKLHIFLYALNDKSCATHEREYHGNRVVYQHHVNHVCHVKKVSIMAILIQILTCMQRGLKFEFVDVLIYGRI